MFEVQCGRADLQICERDHCALFAGLRIEICRKLPHLLREGLHGKRRKDSIQINSSALGELPRVGTSACSAS